MQLIRAESPKRPSVQSLHTTVPLPEEYRPGAHAIHAAFDVAPMPEEKRPGTQAVHATALLLDEKRPGGHGAQTRSVLGVPSTESPEPAAHIDHAVHAARSVRFVATAVV